jgi:hypothetical protein
VTQYKDDPRLRQILRDGIPQATLEAIPGGNKTDRTVNLHTSIDFFTPFCFSVDNCLEFQDPLAAARNSAEESRRLDVLVRVNLADPDRQFIPGNVVGQAKVNTPSLRGVWTQANLLHHGLAHTIKEAILAPGHPALGPGEIGFAADDRGVDCHGGTAGLSKDEVAAIVRNVENIEDRRLAA